MTERDMSQNVNPPEVVLPEAAETLVIRPGDLLIIRTVCPVSEFDAEEVKRRAMGLLPGLGGVLVMGGVDGIAVYRPDRVEGV